MRLVLTFGFCLMAQSAMAHPGHLAELAGHNHWLAGAAIGIAGLAALWGALKGKTEEDEEPAEESAEEQPA
ncbi:DUF6732 family protein [Yoonia sp. BS5-3]|uniref:DUF6732 family protein n=1 Tax=Yoonia phaeophyticola TaxID=3137369 RepID=A0ABZ2V8S2_9RHOB